MDKPSRRSLINCPPRDNRRNNRIGRSMRRERLRMRHLEQEIAKDVQNYNMNIKTGLNNSSRCFIFVVGLIYALHQGIFRVRLTPIYNSFETGWSSGRGNWKKHQPSWDVYCVVHTVPHRERAGNDTIHEAAWGSYVDNVNVHTW